MFGRAEMFSQPCAIETPLVWSLPKPGEKTKHCHQERADAAVSRGGAGMDETENAHRCRYCPDPCRNPTWRSRPEPGQRGSFQPRSPQLPDPMRPQGPMRCCRGWRKSDASGFSASAAPSRDDYCARQQGNKRRRQFRKWRHRARHPIPTMLQNPAPNPETAVDRAN